MIPGVITNFLQDEATVAYCGTRDQNLIPHFHKVSGWSVSPDQETISCLISEAYTPHLISSLEDNGQLALTVSQIGTNETYQFKGEYVDHRPINPADLVIFEQCQGRFGDIVSSMMGLSEDVVQAYFLKPSLVISFKVREIFLQTPGPGAGHRLAPPEEK